MTEYGYMWLHAVADGYIRLHAVTCGYMRLHAIIWMQLTEKNIRLRAVTYIYKQLHGVTRNLTHLQAPSQAVLTAAHCLSVLTHAANHSSSLKLTPQHLSFVCPS